MRSQPITAYPSHYVLAYDAPAVAVHPAEASRAILVWAEEAVWEYRQLILVILISIAALILVMNFFEAGPGFLLGSAAVIGAGAYLGAAIVFLVATRRG